ncbi:DUF6282 family protein [Chloroflexota bacterium]
MSKVNELLQGSIDMHCHHGPDTILERSVDALQATQQAQEAGMKAIVLKSHVYPTAPLAYIINQIVPDFTAVGAICLDEDVGGLNTHALEASAKLGAKVVWMPTSSSANDMKRKGLSEPGIAISDEKGVLLPVVGEILDIVKEYKMALATGHVSVAESFALVDEARKKGIDKIIITHPLLSYLGATLNLEEQKKMADKGAFIEHCFGITMPGSLVRFDPKLMADAVKAVGAERCIMSTDLGQAFNPKPADGMRVGIAVMLRLGLTEKEVDLLVKVNPAKLLGLD